MRLLGAVALCALSGWLACAAVNSAEGPAPVGPGGGGGSAGGEGGGTAGAGATASGGATGGGPGACDDNVQNGGETDVDCGGSCPPCANGQTCNTPTDCDSGQCAAGDGVCCDAACDGTCEACVAGKTGVADGTCAPVAADTDPDQECPAGPVAQCGVGGIGCDGQGACLLYPPGTECVPASCVGGTATTAAECDGTGNCQPGTQTPCAPYVCDTTTQACKTSCSGDADCVPPATCGSQSTCEQATTFDTHNFMGYTEYPLDTDVCQCCGGTTTAQTANAFCVLAGMTQAVSWTTGNIIGTNCYCWDCTVPNQWASNCCSGSASRPMILTVTCV